jgi:redox-sensitive bicupin YhaK (pirin superfamily)
MQPNRLPRQCSHVVFGHAAHIYVPHMTTRTLQLTIPSVPASDGAGVKLQRSIGQRPGAWLDPFLMLDEFFSDNPNDYLAGFPPHPHRGFETVTYILDGHMLHEDHLGNRGDLVAGGVQWMTAGRGIVHSEMPQQAEGRMRGFQLWINLPAAQKMKPASYRDIAPQEIPNISLPNGGTAKLIAGSLNVSGQTHAGPIQGLSTDPLYADIELPAGGKFEHTLDASYTAFVYPYEGAVNIGEHTLLTRSVGVLNSGERIELSATAPVRFLLLAGKPLREPIVQYGPFVMNTRQEIEKAIHDFQTGTF